MGLEMKMWIVTRNLMFVVVTGLANASVFADSPKTDTTKATVIDDLRVLVFNGNMATEYLFDTVGLQLLDIIAKTATVPLRVEKSETKNGKVRWLPIDKHSD